MVAVVTDPATLEDQRIAWWTEHFDLATLRHSTTPLLQLPLAIIQHSSAQHRTAIVVVSHRIPETPMLSHPFYNDGH